MQRALAFAVFLASAPAYADRDLCAPDAKHHGAAISLDLKDAELHDVLRLIADVARVNLVVPDTVTGHVTVKLKLVPWDAAACAIAATHRLSLRVDGNILTVRPSR